MTDFFLITFAFLHWLLSKDWSLSPFTFDLDFLSQRKHLLPFVPTDACRRAVDHSKPGACLCMFGFLSKRL